MLLAIRRASSIVSHLGLKLIADNASARGVLGISRERRSKHRKVHTNSLAERRPRYVPVGNVNRQRCSRRAALSTDFAMAKAYVARLEQTRPRTPILVLKLPEPAIKVAAHRSSEDP